MSLNGSEAMRSSPNENIVSLSRQLTRDTRPEGNGAHPKLYQFSEKDFGG